LAFTPDGSMLISGGADGVRFWEVQKGTMLRWTRTTGIVSALAISRDGKTCAAGTNDGAIHLWRDNGAEIIGSIASPSQVEHIEFSPDGRWLVSTGWDVKSNNTVRFWDVASRKKVWELPGQPLEVFWRNTTAFSTDGDLFAMGTEKGEVQIWNTGQKQKVRELKEGANGKRARILGFAKKNTLLFTLSQDGPVRIWDVENGKLLEKVGERFSINAALSPDAGTIAYGDGKNVKLWDIKAKERRLATPGHHGTIWSIDFSPDGKTLVSGSDDNTVRFWDVEQRKDLRHWSTGEKNHAWQVRYSKDGRTLLTANWQYAEVRDPSSGKLKATVGGRQWALTDARIGLDQKTVVGVAHKEVTVWNIEANRVLRTFAEPAAGRNASAISPDGKSVALSHDNGVDILETTTGKKIHAEKNQGRFESLAFSPDGQYLAWRVGETIVVWNMKRMETQHRIKTRGHVRAIAFDQTGRYLAAAGNGPRIRLWEVKVGKPVGEFAYSGSEIYCVAFSPTEDILASAGDDGTVTLWDLAKKTVPEPPPTTDDLLRRLLAAYGLYGLPLPPVQTKLVRFDQDKESYLGLLVEPAKGKDQPAIFWHLDRFHGFFDPSEPDAKLQAIEPTPAAIRGNPRLWDDKLPAAIHCKSLGWDALAKALFEAEINSETAEEDLATAAWYHWSNKVQEPDGNWPEIARHLRTIVDARPKDFAAYQMQFVRSLELALIPSKAKPGSLEALVDDLVEVRQFQGEVDPRYQKLALRGFEAVPILIKHLDDKRLTKTYRQGFNNFHGYQYRVCDLATDMLQELAGKDLGAWRLRGDLLSEAPAKAWWEEASKVGEEAYVVKNVLGDKESKWLNTLMLEIITRRYANQLPQLYRKMLDERPMMNGSPILQAIADSSLPAAQKRQLFELGAKHQDSDHRRKALEHLKKLSQ
jgi:WD40 repeat protein